MAMVSAVAVIVAMRIKELPISVKNTENGCFLTYLNGRHSELNISANVYLNELCLRNCSTLEGRLDACRNLLTITQKACLLISERSEEVYFPVKGLKDKDNEWFLFSSIVTYHSISDNSSELIFMDGSRKVTDTNYRTIKMQMKRCRELILSLG